MELVDDAFDKFVGQAGGRGKRGREVLPEEIKVRDKNIACCADLLRGT
jgi:hypothetical protein